MTSERADGSPVTAPASGRRIAGAVAWQLGGRVLGTIASIGSIALTTRALGPESYGHLNSAIFFIGLWTSLTELGIGVVIVRRVSAGVGSLQRLVGINLAFSLSYCLPLAALAAVSGWLVYSDQPEVQSMLLIVSASLILTTLSSCLNPIFMSAVRFSAVALADTLSRVAMLAVTIVLVTMGSAHVWYALPQVVAPATLLGVQAIGAHRITPLRLVVSASETWSLVRDSLPQTIVLVIGVLYWRIDGVILSLLSTPAEVGRYGLAYQTAFTLSLMGNFFLGATLSAMAGLFASSRERFAAFIERSMGLMLAIAVPIAVVGFFVGRDLVALLGSEQFVDKSNLVMPLLLVAVGLTFLTGTVSQALFAAHRQAFLLRLNVFNLAGNVLLNIALIPHLGSLGAAIALVACEVAGLIVASVRLSTCTSYRTPWIFLIRLSIPTLGAVGALVLSARWLPDLMAAAIAVVVYVGVNLWAGPVHLHNVRELLRKEDANG
ncbi:O-antigen/teichoic acid export membrane protein [Mycobacteroides chelonae]|nr:O-antigen/teichoic acid export membrane protein [Mycobacteroides chelonae]